MLDPGCSTNSAIAYNFLTGRGLSSEQAAAVIGNLQVESPGLEPRQEAMDTDGLPHRGIAAWGPPRWQALLTFSNGSDPWALETQLAFLWHELETDPSLGLSELRSSTTIDAATITFQNRFERCAPALCHPEVRIRKANAALACLSIRPPTLQKRVGIVGAAFAMLSLAAAAGYGAYKLLPIARRA